MSAERELLELAAKAAGITGWTYAELAFGEPVLYVNNAGIWNPIGDSGDALELMVHLHLDVNFMWDGCDDQYDTILIGTHGAKCDVEEPIGCYMDSPDIDEPAALRRAIVMAAARIGKAMP